MCTRVVYSGSNGMVATGRSMDWKTDMHSNLWVFPRGMKRNGETGENSLEWTSRYGSVVTSAFERIGRQSALVARNRIPRKR